MSSRSHPYAIPMALPFGEETAPADDGEVALFVESAEAPEPADNDELSVRAEQVQNLTWKQYEDIKSRAVALGLPEQVAATMPLLAADPQAMHDQLKRARRSVIAPGITGTVLQCDVIIAALIRAPENLRMGQARYSGRFELPLYETTPENNALTFDLRGEDSLTDATEMLFRNLAKVDDEIDANNPYGADIAANGVRVGGLLCPLLVGLPDHPWIGGWETADCYGRTYFAQEAEKIRSQVVLDWLSQVPTTSTELRNHPLQKLRTDLLSIAGKVIAGNTKLTERETLQLVRAVMPATRLVVRVYGDVPMAEVRRRLVSHQHLDRPTPFSADTEWQVRAEAVLNGLQAKGLLACPPDVAPAEVRRWLDKPRDAIATGACQPDDIAALACASLLHAPDSTADRVIASALKTRGVTGKDRTVARTLLTAHVVARVVDDEMNRDSRRSAMERALVWTGLRGLLVDMRPIQEILMDAREELKAAAEKRSMGKAPGVGPSTAQIAVRAAYHLTCGSGAQEPVLRRSSHGAGKGQAAEPAEILRKLATSSHGLEQLAQAIFDGRRRMPPRAVEVGTPAADTVADNADQQLLTSDTLRELAGSAREEIINPTAASLVSEDTDLINDIVNDLDAAVNEMASRRDDEDDLAYVEERGWRDPRNSVATLSRTLDRMTKWKQLHEVVNRVRRPAERPVDGDL
jgi:hypothetical protein